MFNDLVTPKFPVEKAKDVQTGKIDVRAVWDSKRNGLDATMWAPKFMLPTTSDSEDLVTMWLSTRRFAL